MDRYKCGKINQVVIGKPINEHPWPVVTHFQVPLIQFLVHLPPVNGDIICPGEFIYITQYKNMGSYIWYDEYKQHINFHINSQFPLLLQLTIPLDLFLNT